MRRGRNEITTSKVTKIFVHRDVSGYLIINDELQVTPEHPLYDGDVWRPAGDYKVGDVIQYIDHTYKDIVSIESRSETVTVYNFEVESSYHNYYADGYLAHNMKGNFPPGGSASISPQQEEAQGAMNEVMAESAVGNDTNPELPMQGLDAEVY